MIKLESLPPDIQSRFPAARAVLAKDPNVVFAYLFGGFASGRVTPLSDVDIAVFLATTDDLGEYTLELFDSLTESLGSTELDLVILNTAPLSLAGRILQNKKLLVDKDSGRRHAYESLTLRKFFDFKVKEEQFFRWRCGRDR